MYIQVASGPKGSMHDTAQFHDAQEESDTLSTSGPKHVQKPRSKHVDSKEDTNVSTSTEVKEPEVRIPSILSELPE